LKTAAMKKIVLVILICVLLAIASVYIFIPNVITFNRSLRVNANRDGLFRMLSNEKTWSSWWPGTSQADSFKYHHVSYTIDKKTIGSLLIRAVHSQAEAATLLNFISVNTDTTALIWTGGVPTSYSPLKRLQIFLDARSMEKNIDTLLKQIQLHFSKQENLYGYPIREVAIQDSLLVFTDQLSTGYPSTAFVYTLVDKLHTYTTSQSAKETGYPMLNVTTTDSIHFLTQVAIPVNRVLFPSSGISFKRMLAEGNILAVDVKGGPVAVQRAFRQVENYIVDYHRTPPAMPFVSMVTDRRQQPDTTQWVTRIYYPVM
jgi:hypothetical protein